MNAVIDAWREKLLAHEREAAALRDGETHGHGHGHGGHAHGPGGHGGFAYSNRPLDPYRADDPRAQQHLRRRGAGHDGPRRRRRQRVGTPSPSRRAPSTSPSSSRPRTPSRCCEAVAAEIGLTNLTVIQSPWVEADAPSADVALCSLVLHHVPDAAPFVSKLQEHATDRVVVVEMMETPGALEIPFYERVHGSAPTPLPGLPDVLRLLWAMDIHPDVAMLTAETAVLDTDRAAAMEQLRRRLGVEEGTAADDRLRAAADELLEDTPEGYTVKGVSPRRTAMVTWTPARNGA